MVTPTTTCRYCGEQVSQSNLSRHIARNHSEVPPPPPPSGARLYCSLCKKTFDRSQKSRHIKTNHNGDVLPEGTIQPAAYIEHSQSRPGHPGGTSPPRPQMSAEAYIRRCRDARRRACEQLTALDVGSRDNGTQLADQVPVYLGIMKTALLPTVRELTRDATTITAPVAFDEEANGYDLIICSDHQARVLLQYVTPKVPLFIPRDRNSRPPHCLSLETYLDILATKETVDIHDFDSKPSAAGFTLPTTLAGKKVVQKLRSESKTPVNLLNLHPYKPNAQPWFVAENEDLQLITTVDADAIAGHRRELGPLEVGTQFQICGKAGAFSMPHCDRHGVITTVFCDDGEKLWLTWPHLNREETITWADGPDYCPRYRPFAVHLRTGDMLIVPPGRIHAPFSMSNVLMSGTMHWDSRNMVEVARQSLLQVDHPSITNEETASDCLGKLEAIRKCWSHGAGPWKWGSRADLKEFSRLVKVSPHRSSRSTRESSRRR